LCRSSNERTSSIQVSAERWQRNGPQRKVPAAVVQNLAPDTEVADRYLEIFPVNSWAEHLRQHERQTQADGELEGRIYSYLSGEPTVRHLIDTYTTETLTILEKANATAFRQWRSWLRGRICSPVAY
jgi:hypothetical protein